MWIWRRICWCEADVEVLEGEANVSSDGIWFVGALEQRRQVMICAVVQRLCRGYNVALRSQVLHIDIFSMLDV